MKRHLRIAPVAVAAALFLGACAEEATVDEVADPAADVEATDEAMETMEEMETMEDMASEEPTAAASMDPAMAGPVGPGCADFASTVPDGEGSVEGMSDDPVAVAASNNPILTNLTAAVSGELNPDVNLVDTLNGDEFTVFAPVDDPAFAALDEATLETLSTDAELLRNILTYHVVPGQIAPADLAGTTQTTVQGGTVEITGEPDMLMVNGAQVICGGVTTANATVYLIDAVLMPAS